MATATDSESTVKLAAERGYLLISAFLEPADRLRAKADSYEVHARTAGRANARRDVLASRIVYVAGSKQEAVDDMRDAVAFETTVQNERGFLKVLKNLYQIDVPPGEKAIDALVDSGFYVVGDPDDVAGQLKDFYDEAGGFGTFLYVTGKDWACREKRARSMRLFMEDVAPQLRDLEPAGATTEAA